MYAMAVCSDVSLTNLRLSRFCVSGTCYLVSSARKKVSEHSNDFIYIFGLGAKQYLEIHCLKYKERYLEIHRGFLEIANTI